MPRKVLLATSLLSAAIPALCAKERILLHRIGPSEIPRCSSQKRTAPTSVRFCQIPALITTARSLLTGSGSSLPLSGMARPTSIGCTRMVQAWSG